MLKQAAKSKSRNMYVSGIAKVSLQQKALYKTVLYLKS